jgi:hypothetical protein
MKKNICLQITIAMAVLVLSFGCNKEAAKPTSANTKQGDQYHLNASDASSVATTFYTACGLSITVFNPNPNLQYSFEYHNYNSSAYIPFGVINYGDIIFNSWDKFTFEFAGYTARPAVKTWRIKRADGKYLTADNGILMYETKILKGPVNEQIFLIGTLGNSRYELVNPGLCTLGTIGFDFDYGGYRFFVDPSAGTNRDYRLGLISY